MISKANKVDPRQQDLFVTPVAERAAVSITRLDTLPSLDGVDSLGFDTETTTEKRMRDRSLVGFSYHLPDGRADYVALRHPGGGNRDEEQAREWVRRELRGKQLVVANAKHEVDTLARWGVDLEAQGCRTRDVFNQAALLNDHRHKLNLSIITEEELPDRKRIEADHAQIWQMPVAQAAPIAVEDAELAWRLNEVYTPRIADEELGAVLDLEDDLVYAVCEMERNGAYLNVEKLVRWDAEVEEEYGQRILAIHRATGLRVNPNSGDDLARLARHLGLRSAHVTATGKESFTEEALLEITHPVMTLVTEARQLSSLSAKYLKKYLRAVEPSGVLRYQLHQLRGDEYGTITGRFSSSNVNIQQVQVQKKQPKLLQCWPIRELFIAAPGEAGWVSADASQIEFRIFAHYAEQCGMPRLARAYRADPKTDFHALVVGWTGLIREFAKNVNFCKLYGGGARKVALMLKVSLEEAERLVAMYDREFPEARTLIRLAGDQAERIGFVRTLLGRCRRFPGKDERFYSALNAVFQGSAADVMKQKLLELYRERKRLGLTLRFTVHDEADGGLQDLGSLPRMQELLNEQTSSFAVPILWDIGHGVNWHEAH